MNGTPQELNWVEKRSACSVEQVFRELQNGIESDVASLNAIRRYAPDNRFIAQLTSDGRVLIVAQEGVSGPRVKFFTLDGKIEVRDEVTSKRLLAALTLNNEGRCKLKLEDGMELEQWQLRKMALEGLFFGVPESD
jgi:hypothetical protein